MWLFSTRTARCVRISHCVRSRIVSGHGGKGLLLATDPGTASDVVVVINDGRFGETVVVVPGLGDVENEGLFRIRVLRVRNVVDLVDSFANASNSFLC